MLLRALVSLSLWLVARGSDGGASLYFDGLDDWASVFPGFSLLSDWTIEFWVRPASPIEYGQCILSLQTLAGTNLLTFTSTPSLAYEVLFGPDSVGIPEANWTDGTVFNGLYVSDITHVALSHEVLAGSTSGFNLYLDSALQASWNLSSQAVSSDLYFQQGRLLPTTLGACYVDGESDREQFGRGLYRSHYFKGHLDEVRWWNVARTATEVAETWVFSGDPLMWPVPGTTVPNAETSGKTVDPTDASVIAQANAIQAKYSCDQIQSRLIDGSGNNLNGWRGSGPNRLDQPTYEASVFGSFLRLGAEYRELRASSTATINFEQVILGHFLLGAQTYNSLYVVSGLTNTAVGTTITGNTFVVGSSFTAGALISGLSLTVTTGADAVPDTFIVQPCRGATFQTPQVAECSGEREYPVTFSVASSTVPYAGAGFALQLLKEGAFARLPRPPSETFTLEFQLQLTQPFQYGAPILSIQRATGSPATSVDPLLIWLDPAAGGVVFEMCQVVDSVDTAMQVAIPGIGIEAAQHIALNFDFQVNETSGRTYYNMSFFQDCTLVSNFIVHDPCYGLNSEDLHLPTLGQRYRDDEPGSLGVVQPWSDSFCPMYLAEIRMWNEVRTDQEICFAMELRLNGTEPTLYMYAPVLEEDSIRAAAAEAVAVAERAASQLDVFQVTPGSTFSLETGMPVIASSPRPPTIEVVCSGDLGVCPDATNGIGWQVRQGVFVMVPPETTVIETIRGVDTEVTFLGADPDNIVDNLVLPTTRDTVSWEILTYPDPICLHLFELNSLQSIPTPFDDPCCTRSAFGLPAREAVSSANLPLRLVPFGGATADQILALGEICTTSFTYRARDSTGKVSDTATVFFQVFLRGPELLNVTAVEVGTGDFGLDGGDVLLFRFDLPSETAFTDPTEIFDVIDGSWGSSAPTGVWAENNYVFVVTLAGGFRAGRAVLTPGVTRFQVKRSANVLRQGEVTSKPATTLSPVLFGDFSTAQCSAGDVFEARQEAAACYPCPAGTYWRTTGSDRGVEGVACESCPAGTFSNATGLTACTECEAGRYMTATAADRTECVDAPIGSFVAEMGEDDYVWCTNGSVQESARQTSCYGCPNNANCDGGTMPSGEALAGTLAIPTEGHFRQSALFFPECAVPSACFAGGFCKEGHKSPELGCYECEQDWSRWESMLRHRSECFKCPSKTVSSIALISVVAIGVFLALPLASLGFTIAFRAECLHLFMIKILFNHLAMMHIFTTFEIWEMRDGFGDMAEAIRHLFSALYTWDGSVPVYAIPVRCFIQDVADDVIENSNNLDKLWAELIIWALLPITFPVLCTLLGLLYAESYVLIKRCTGCVSKPPQPDEEPEGGEREELSGVVPDLQRGGSAHSITSRASGVSRASTGSLASDTWDVGLDEERLLGIWRKGSGLPFRKRMERFMEDTFSIFVATSILIYAPTVRQLLTFLQCGAITGKPESDLRLLVAPQVVCGKDDDFNSIMVFAWIALIVWGVGLPLLSAFLLWNWQSTWARYATRCKVALLGADFHPSYFFWDSVTRFRTFAVIVAGSVTTNVPRTMMLGMLLTVGLVFLVMHAIHLPFDNRSGQLLDSVEENGLSIFCAMCAAMLVAMSDIAPDGVGFSCVFLVWLADVLYLIHSCWLIWGQVRRSLADSFIEAKLNRQMNPSMFDVSTHFWDRVCEWAFHRQEEAETKRSLVAYDHKTNSVKLESGSAGKPVRDSERTALVQGLVDCIEHAVLDAKVESLSVYLIEYIMRHAFAVHYVRICNEGDLRSALKQRRASRVTTSSQDYSPVTPMRALPAAAPAVVVESDPDSGAEGASRVQPRPEEDEGPSPTRRIKFDAPDDEEEKPPVPAVSAVSMASSRPRMRSQMSRHSQQSKETWVSMVGLMKVSKHWLFRPEPFDEGMTLIDIQAVLIKFLSFSKHSLESHYFQFMRRRGAKGEYKMKPRDRLLQKVGLEKPKHAKAKDAKLLYEADPTAVNAPAAPPPAMEVPPPLLDKSHTRDSNVGRTSQESLPVPRAVVDAETTLPPFAAADDPTAHTAQGPKAILEDEDLRQLPAEQVEVRLDRSRRELGEFEPPPEGRPRHSLSERSERAIGLAAVAQPTTEAPLMVTRSGVQTANQPLRDTLQ